MRGVSVALVSIFTAAVSLVVTLGQGYKSSRFPSYRESVLQAPIVLEYSHPLSYLLLSLG